MLEELVEFVRNEYKTEEFIPLHAPNFDDKEKGYLNEVIDSGFVSSVGEYVTEFEHRIQSYSKAAHAVAVVNGTCGLHAALYASGVRAGDLVLTQSLTFVATCNAIHQLGAKPVFIDINRESLGLCPKDLELFLKENTDVSENKCIHIKTGQVIKAVVPMHTFGHPVQLDEIVKVSNKYHLTVVEDAAESLGSLYKGTHTGSIGDYGVFSFNGNKIITTGGGGVVITNNEKNGAYIKHLTTTAKKAHPYEFFHDVHAFNYRMPNLNAALGCAQLERLSGYIENKRYLAAKYRDFFKGSSEYEFVDEPNYARSNFWLNAIICPDHASREEFLDYTNSQEIMTRPVWVPMHRLPMFENCISGNLSNTEWLADRLVNLPSSPIMSV